ncbi:S-adenosyl-L-methionine-dependent methyltransferase [Clavulina sp. PMI_390]|nr:S-adenosyl-L-methionine-dependent methyltransferase [Clavulina sp. PMI_390]
MGVFSPVSILYLAPLAGAVVIYSHFEQLKTYFLFVWHCFIVPLGKTSDQKARLDKFYQGQAEVYDATRKGLLRGRNTMLAMSAEHLRVIRANHPNQRLVWVDVGGGTGWNVETMDKHFPISQFDAVYVVDLCKPLLEIAAKRFAARGWTNVYCLCQDATTFTLPEWSDGIRPKGSLGFISLSYSLSMIPSYHTLLDRLDYLLNPDLGLMAVVDFYASGKEPTPHEKAIGGQSKQVGWISRWFWQIWFDFDHVDLSPGRRDYVEYRFGTIKSYNGRNRFVLPFIVRIPYYIWIGCSRSRDTSRFAHAFEVEGGNLVGNCSPKHGPTVPALMQITGDEKTEFLPLPTQARKYLFGIAHPEPLPKPSAHAEFRTFIYSFTWEDPAVDMQHLNLSENDSIFAITSAGDNVLHYAINAKPRRIHAVDMNPCQGHLLELKLAAIKAFDHETFFSLFGDGKHPSFRQLLDGKLSAYLSSPAYQFWRLHSGSFDPSSSFYLRGYSGWALRIAHWLISLTGHNDDVKALCEARTLKEQDEVWRRCLRPVFVDGSVVQRLVDNPIFLWNALGVPKNQKEIFTKEGTVYEFIRDTLDPIGSHALLSQGAYHYLLCLLGHYTRESCPDYLSPRGFEALKANDGELLDSFRLHTDSIVNVLSGLSAGAITRAVIMDHLDWFAPGAGEVDEEVAEMRRALAPGGMVFWRSAAKRPWYNEVFERAGFVLECLGMREGPKRAIDRVNMYASFWKATKV